MGKFAKFDYAFKLRGITYSAMTKEALVKEYERLRDESYEGASTFPMPVLYYEGKKIGRIAYNGRIMEK